MAGRTAEPPPDPLATAQALRELNQALTEAIRRENALRALYRELNSYVIYLINSIRELCEWKPLDFQAWQIKHSKTPLTPFALLVSAFVDAFSASDFDKLLLLRLDKRREVLTQALNFEDVVINVLQIAEREGWLRDLKSAALTERPNNNALRRAITVNQ